MEDDTENSLEHQADPQGVEEAVLLDQPQTGPVVHSGSVLFRGKSPGLAVDDGDEEDPVHDVAAVTHGVVEVREDPERPGTAEIEITSVDVAEFDSRGELGVDQLEGRNEVEDGEERNQQEEEPGAQPPVPDTVSDVRGEIRQTEVVLSLFVQAPDGGSD